MLTFKKLVVAGVTVAITALVGCAAEEEEDADVGASQAASSTGCGVQGGQGRCGVRKLYCDNEPNVYVMDHDLVTRKGILQTSHSVFLCWWPKGGHKGGNDVWYWTQSDVTLSGDGFGWVPAWVTKTSNHPAPGLPKCGSQDDCKKPAPAPKADPCKAPSPCWQTCGCNYDG